MTLSPKNQMYFPKIIVPPEERAGFQGEVAIFDLTYPRSLINIVPDVIKNAILRVKENQPAYFFLPEHQLKSRCKPTPEVNHLKLTFWDEYNKAQDEQRTMNMNAVVKGICSLDFFYGTVIRNDKFFAWMVSPPKDVFAIQREMLMVGLEEQREILTMPHKNGRKIDYALIKYKLQIIESLKVRVLGAVTQRMETKSLNVHVGTPPGPTALSGDVTLDKLLTMEKSLERLEKQTTLELKGATDVELREATTVTEADGPDYSYDGEGED